MRVAVGDISSETSMEDILSSIKRIIAEEGDGAAAPVRGRKSIRPTHAQRDPDDRAYDRDEVLELDETVAAPPPPAAPPRAKRPRASQPEPQPEPAPFTPPPHQEAAIVSDRAAEASRGALDQLSRLVVKPEVAGGDSLEAMVREMLRPMLRDWLDAKLPEMVETMVAREIARITARD